MTQQPTSEQFDQYRAAFDYFNEQLFQGGLPPLMLNFSRKAKSLGYFVPEMWARTKGKGLVAEISLNPDHLAERGLKDTMSTLVHEMAHHWQQCFGKPSRAGYHNKEWAAKMKAVGLYPSTTGEEGGKEVGQRMDHYIVKDGPFDAAFEAMPESIRLPWCTAAKLEGKKKSAPKKPSKTPYVCPSCETKVWAKPGLTNLRCGDCEEDFIAVQ